MAISLPWRLDGKNAALDAGPLSGTLDLEQPETGLTDLAWNNASIAGTLWGWTVADRTDPAAANLPSACRDAYIRGDDLVVTYGPSKACPFETQLYWRAAHGSGAGLSLVVSIRTHLLDTLPVVQLTSRRPAAETLTAIDSEPLAFGPATDDESVVAIVQRLGEGDVSIGEASHPGDQSVFTQDAPSGAVGWTLFSHFLEKGVIRRARLTMAVAPTNEVEAATATAYQTLLAEPLPLTT